MVLRLSPVASEASCRVTTRLDSSWPAGIDTPMLLRTSPLTSGFIEPCLPSSAERPPSGPGWIHEIKHDGYRLMARRDPIGVRLLTRMTCGQSEACRPCSEEEQ